MWAKIQNAFSAPSLAAARNVLMAVAAVFGTLGVVSATQAQDVVNKLMDIGTAIGTLMAAVSALVLVATPIFAALKSTMASQKKAVSLQPHTMVVEAATHDAALKAAAAIAAIPEVQQVTASPGVANATVSNKVVAAADAKTITVADAPK